MAKLLTFRGRDRHHVNRLWWFLCLILLTFSCTPCPEVFAKETTISAQLPLGEHWHGIYFNSERVGFSRQHITATTGGYRIEIDGSMKVLVLGFSREVSSKETYQVNEDLTLRAFSIEQSIDKSQMKLTGDMTDQGLHAVIENSEGRKERLLKTNSVIYPAPVLNVVLIQNGFVAGSILKLQTFDPESIKLKEVSISAVGVETTPTGRQYHFRNNLYPAVGNDVWVDEQGETIRESVRNGLMETRAEDENTAGKFLLDAVVSKKDLALDYSLIRPDRAIANPALLKELQLTLFGLPANLPLLSGAGQQVARQPDGSVIFSIIRKKTSAFLKNVLETDAGVQYLAASDRIPVEHPRLRELIQQLVKNGDAPLTKVKKLNQWVAEAIKETVTDSQSVLETLETRRGNCQSHARLYTALARAADIPTRFVSGLVYIPRTGFLYHSWAESYLGEWVALDPTFGQLPADATHIKLVEGETPDEMAPLAGVIGVIRIKINKMVPDG